MSFFSAVRSSLFRRQSGLVLVPIGPHPVDLPTTAIFREQDVSIETLKAGGPGGQHVNTTESAVRVVHLPTGLTSAARDDRSQQINCKRALERLAILQAV